MITDSGRLHDQDLSSLHTVLPKIRYSMIKLINLFMAGQVFYKIISKDGAYFNGKTFRLEVAVKTEVIPTTKEYVHTIPVI